MLGVAQDEVALHAEVRCGRGGGAAVVGLYAADGDDGVVAVCEGLRHEELELADLRSSCVDGHGAAAGSASPGQVEHGGVRGSGS